MSTQPAGLDEPQPVTPVRSVALTVAGVLPAFALLLSISLLDSPWQVVPSYVTVHAYVTGTLALLTCLVLAGYAIAGNRPHFFAVSGAYASMVVTTFSFPFFFPNGLLVSDPPTVLVGTFQSGIALYIYKNITFPLLLAIGAIVIYRRGANRSTSSLLRSGFGWMGLGVGVGVLGLIVVGPASALLPELITSSSATPAGYLGLYSVVAACLVGLIITGFTARSGSLLSLWLTMVMSLELSAALISAEADSRFSASWYLQRGVQTVALSVLLIALIWQVARLDRSASLAVLRDPLTGAASRLGLLTQMERELSTSRPRGATVLLWVDVDSFKAINDEWGYPAGDGVLREIVSRIDQVVGNEGMVGRLGGDEIGVAVTGPEAHHRADRLASSIVHAVRTAIPVDGHTASISVSVGVAQSGSASTLDELVVHAELAMQAVKANGGDSYRWFEDWMVVPSITVAQTRSDFLASVEANQVSVVYQPIVAAETGRLMAVEALARWNRAGRELTPATFLAELDRAGLLPTLGTTVISQVGVDSEVIWRQHPEVLIFVNLSTRELAAPEVIDVLLAGPLGDRPGHVVVEVTEQIEMIAQGPARASLTRLVDAGMKVAIDDFGSGYSSLERIVTVAPSVLKLDRFLIDHAMEHANQGSKVLETAIALGRSLGCVLVAEGVETEEERRVVTELGVTWVQGYLIARPAPLSSLGRFPSGMPEEI